jgi:hypothetical protein
MSLKAIASVVPLIPPRKVKSAVPAPTLEPNTWLEASG